MFFVFGVSEQYASVIKLLDNVLHTKIGFLLVISDRKQSHTYLFVLILYGIPSVVAPRYERDIGSGTVLEGILDLTPIHPRRSQAS